MITTIYLYDKLLFDTDEIYNIITDNMLPVKFNRQLSCPNMFPQQSFCVSLKTFIFLGKILQKQIPIR